MKTTFDRRNPFVKQLDISSEEYSPTAEETRRNLEDAGQMDRVLFEIEQELRDPGHFDYGAEYGERRVMNPQDLWDQITYAWMDIGDHITDPEEKGRLKKRSEALGQKIFNHFIPFLAMRVQDYGSARSYFVAHPERSERIKWEVRLEEDFNAAYLHIRSYEIAAEDRVELLNEIDQVKQKAEEYRREPWLHGFEKQEIVLWRDFDFPGIWMPPHQDEFRSFGAKPEQDRMARHLDQLFDEAEALRQIVERMRDPEIKERSESRAQTLKNILDRKMLAYHAPRELLTLQARLDDVISDLQAGGGGAVKLRLDAVQSKLDGLHGLEYAQRPVRELYQKIQAKYRRAVRMMHGETFDPQDVDAVDQSDPDWAVSIFGLKSSATPIEIKQAYKVFVRKNHPDLFISEADKQRQEGLMKKINEAYRFLKSLGRLDTKDGAR